MRYKKIMILTILLVSLLAVSAVSAADNATSDILSVDETTDEVVSVNDDNQVILEENNNVGTFTNLANEIANANGELNLTRDYTYDEDSDYDYMDGISIDKSITVNGNGFTIDGNTLAKSFKVTSNNVFLININFINNVGERGASVYWEGDKGFLVNCSFVNNVATSYSGGAVYWEGLTGSLVNCSFLENSANTGGGAVSWSGANGFIANSCFINNHAGNYYGGGAVYWATNGNKGILINCTFINNTANNGNCVYWHGSDGILANCNFVNCSAEVGGAVYWEGSDGILANCSFVNCSAEVGGAVYWDDSHGSAVSCTFVGNSAESGGAMYGGSAVNCTFIGNSANSGGGAMSGGSAENCIFSNNTAMYGGAIEEGAAVNCTFIGNSVIEDGGAMSSGSAVSCTFINNTAKWSGGAIYHTDAENCIFQNNYADIGGAMFRGISLNSTFRRNHADNDGGAVYDVVAKDCSFESNFAKNGGAMINGVALNCTFDDNDATDYGGAVYNSKVTTDSKFSNNNAPNGKDTYKVTWLEKMENTKSFTDLNMLINGNTNETDIYLNDNYAFDFDSDLELFREGITVNRPVTVHGNGFTIDGWGIARIFNVESSDSAIFKDIILVNGKNDNLAAAINGMCTAVNCTFICNIAAFAGAMYDGSAVNCTFINNTAKWYGGAMYDGSAVNCIFTGNYAGYGGAINGGSAVNCTFIGNSANSGGAMSSGSAVSCTFINNTAYYYGGAMSTGSAENCIFKGNTAPKGKDTYYTELIKSNMIISAVYDAANKQIVATLTNNATGKTLQNVNIKFELNGETTTVRSNSKGQVIVSVADLPLGTYTAVLSYPGNNIYYPVSTSIDFTVKNDMIISAVYDSANKQIVATLTNNATGKTLQNVNIKFELNGETTTVRSNSKGQVIVSVAVLPIGEYTATISYAGNSIYNPTSTSIDFSTKYAMIIDAVYDSSNKQVVATLTNNATGKLIANANVKVDLNGETNTVKSNSKGQVIVSTADLPTGTYAATISYSGNKIYNPANTSITFTTKINMIIDAVYDGANKQIVATLTNGATGKLIANANVKVNLNGETTTVKSNSKGQAIVSTADFPIGVYTATISYAGNKIYNPASTSIDFSTKAVMIISDIYGSDAELTATLTNSITGKKIVNANVVVNINGVSTTVKSNSKGQIKVSVNGLTSNVYTATISYKGNSIYDAVSTTATVNVDKANIIIAATYDAANKQIVGTLTSSTTGKTLQNVNVKVNLNGVTTTVKSNSKGQVIVQTTDLGAGTYVASLSYQGNSIYNPSSTVVKVDV